LPVGAKAESVYREVVELVATGRCSAPPGELGLFYALDGDGNQVPVTITDKEVNNLQNSSGGGLQAHNYWDNKDQFITPLAELLKTTAA
jgi:hypothetical protein